MVDGGRIITIGSIAGERAAFPGHSIYSATKFAITGMTRALAIELAPRRITANIIQPGPTDTDMMPADPMKNPAADVIRQLIPFGRFGRAEEVAGVALFLASPAAAYVSGATLTVDGAALA